MGIKDSVAKKKLIKNFFKVHEDVKNLQVGGFSSLPGQRHGGGVLEGVWGGKSSISTTSCQHDWAAVLVWV